MTDVQRALYQFWASFGVPAWSQDTVPDSAALPYIVFDTVAGAPMDATILTGTVWLRDDADGVSGNALRAQYLDQIAKAIPPAGVKLPAGDGYIVFYRNSGNFQRTVQDPEDKLVLGGRTTVEAHFYNI